MKKFVLKFLIILPIIFFGHSKALATCFPGAGGLGEEACCTNTTEYCVTGDSNCGGCTCASTDLTAVDLTVVTDARPVNYTAETVCCYAPAPGSNAYNCTNELTCKEENEPCSSASECCAEFPTCDFKAGYNGLVCQTGSLEDNCSDPVYWRDNPITCCGNQGGVGEECCQQNAYQTACYAEGCYCSSGACTQIGGYWKCSGGCGDGIMEGSEQCGEGDNAACRSICGNDATYECNNCMCECHPTEPPQEPGEVHDLLYSGPIITSLADLINPIAMVLYYAGLFIGVFFIVYSGYRLMVSQGDPQQAKDAQEQLTAAILGIMFILLAKAIVTVIINLIGLQ